MIKDAVSHRIVGFSIDSGMTPVLLSMRLKSCRDERGGCRLSDSQRPWIAISKPEGPACSGPISHDRLDGQGRHMRRQRDDGVRLQPAAEKRPQPPLLGNVGETRVAIVTCIERTCNQCRRQAELGRLTPIKFDAVMNTTAALAA